MGTREGGLKKKRLPPTTSWDFLAMVTTVPQAPLYMRETPGSSQINTDAPLLPNPGPTSFILLPNGNDMGCGGLSKRTFFPHKTRALCTTLSAVWKGPLGLPPIRTEFPGISDMILLSPVLYLVRCEKCCLLSYRCVLYLFSFIFLKLRCI